MNIELSKATQDGVVRRHTVQLYRHPSMKTEETRRARVVRVVGRRTDKGASNKHNEASQGCTERSWPCCNCLQHDGLGLCAAKTEPELLLLSISRVKSSQRHHGEHARL